MEAPALLTEALWHTILQQRVQLQMLLADAVPLVIFLLLPDVLRAAFHLYSIVQRFSLLRQQLRLLVACEDVNGVSTQATSKAVEKR